MRTGALIRSYGLTKYLTAVLESYSWVDKILVMNHRFREVKERKDETPILTAPFKNAICKSGEGLDQNDVFNIGLEEFKNFNCIFIADNDELFSRLDQQKIAEELQSNDAITCNILDYAKDFEHIFPVRTHHPIVAVKPNARFYDVRCAGGCHRYMQDVNIHHVGYIHTPEDMAWKLEWERIWENDTIVNLIGKLSHEYSMPQEIRDLING
jgi:hypothetical protein